MTDTTTDFDPETWLDSLDPAKNASRDATHFRRIIAARKQVAGSEAALRSAVAAARAAGDSWAVIGMALDTSRQAAYQRFGKASANDPPEVTRGDMIELEPGREMITQIGVHFTSAQIREIRRMAEDVGVDEETYIRDVALYWAFCIEGAEQSRVPDTDTEPANAGAVALALRSLFGEHHFSMLPVVVAQRLVKEQENREAFGKTEMTYGGPGSV